MKSGLRILAMHISSPALSPKTLPCHLRTRTCVLWTNCDSLQFSTSQIKASSSNQLLHERQKEACSRYFWISQKASFLRCFRFGAWVPDDTVSSLHTITLVSNLDFCMPHPPSSLKLEICRFQTPVGLHHSLPNCFWWVPSPNLILFPETKTCLDVEMNLVFSEWNIPSRAGASEDSGWKLLKCRSEWSLEGLESKHKSQVSNCSWKLRNSQALPKAFTSNNPYLGEETLPTAEQSLEMRLGAPEI